MFGIGPQVNPVVSEHFSLQCEAGSSIRDLCLSSDGERIAVALDNGPSSDEAPPSDRGHVRLINIASRSWEKTSLPFESRPVSIAFAGGDLIVGTRSGFLSRIDGKSLNLVWRIKAQASQMNGIAVIPGGDAIATVGGERGLSLWDLLNGDLRFRLYRHEFQIFGVDASTDGMTIVTGGLGGDVRIWRASRDDERVGTGK